MAVAGTAGQAIELVAGLVDFALDRDRHEGFFGDADVFGEIDAVTEAAADVDNDPDADAGKDGDADADTDVSGDDPKQGPGSFEEQGIAAYARYYEATIATIDCTTHVAASWDEPFPQGQCDYDVYWHVSLSQWDGYDGSPLRS